MATLGGETATRRRAGGGSRRNIRHWEEPGLRHLRLPRPRGRRLRRPQRDPPTRDRRQARRSMLAYALAAERWGRGLATEIAAGLVAYARRAAVSPISSPTRSPRTSLPAASWRSSGFVYERELELHDRSQVLYRSGELDEGRRCRRRLVGLGVLRPPRRAGARGHPRAAATPSRRARSPRPAATRATCPTPT